jgi:bacterioferritin-associated ferredoxin
MYKCICHAVTDGDVDRYHLIGTKCGKCLECPMGKKMLKKFKKKNKKLMTPPTVKCTGCNKPITDAIYWHEDLGYICTPCFCKYRYQNAAIKKHSEEC